MLLPLSLYSQRLIHDLVDKDGFEFDHRQNGKLIIHRQRRSFEAARTLLQKHRELSEFQQALDRDACLALEPSLLRIAERIAGGHPYRQRRSGRLLQAVPGTRRKAGPGPSPVCFRLGEAASGFEVAGGGVRAVITSGGPIRGDACVIAGGAEVGRLLAPLGIRVPVFPLEGYSISLPINDTSRRSGGQHHRLSTQDRPRPPRQSTARRGNGRHRRLREGLNGTRIDTLLRATRETFGAGVDLSTVTSWAGLRPATPTGRPVVDRSPIPKLWLNIGHGALGFTLASGCGQLISDKIAGRQCAFPSKVRTCAHSPSGRRMLATTLTAAASSTRSSRTGI